MKAARSSSPWSLRRRCARAVPLFVHRRTSLLNFLVIDAAASRWSGQGWNILGGYGGQYLVRPCRVLRHRRLCHRDPAGALRRQRLARPCRRHRGRRRGRRGHRRARRFRSGLRGSYFALVTLAFAEVFRILANVAPITGGGVGTADQARPARRGVPVPEPRRRSTGSSLGAGRCCVAGHRRLIERSRFGAQLVAVRENEDAAQALGVDVVRASSCGHHALGRDDGGGRRLLRAVFPLSSTPASPTAPGSRSRRCWRRSSAASARCSARCSARWCCTCSARHAQAVTGDAPGLDLVALRRRADPDRRLRAARHHRRLTRAADRRPFGPDGRAMLSRCGRDVSKRFGGLLAVDDASLTRAKRAHHRR